ncbi:MAG: type II secretion system F family protein [Candidatus Omnitrophota bacterium]|nr:MAG: type II secretion system F family protein [Candidatus Omnitrophota bacterium]
MALFNYIGTDQNGKKVKGRVDAPTLEEVINKLRSENIIILDIVEVKRGTVSGRVGGRDLAIFARQLSSLIAARIPIVKSLVILAGQTEKRSLREIILSIQKSIKAGETLAGSFSKYPQVFSPLFINMINVGEFSGNLDVVLERLASYIEGYNALVRKVRSALTYPIAIVVVATVVMVLIFIFVVPGFEQIYESLEGSLPMPTQILINISNFIRTYFWYVMLGLALVIFSFNRFLATSKGMDITERIRSRLPVMGILYQKMVLARFTKTLALLVRSGVPILNALEIAGKTSGSNRLEKFIMHAKDEVARGKKLGETLREADLFPSMATSMVSVGEEGGDLGGMLEKIAELYDRDVDLLASGLLALLEPFIIVFLGFVIGAIVVCLFLPIIKMYELVR